MLSLAPGHLAEPKDKANRALQLMALPGMEGRSGSCAGLTWRALGEAALKQVSMETGRLSAPGGLVLSLPRSLPPSLPQACDRQLLLLPQPKRRNQGSEKLGHRSRAPWGQGGRAQRFSLVSRPPNPSSLQRTVATLRFAILRMSSLLCFEGFSQRLTARSQPSPGPRSLDSFQP